jgi:NhaP-type Na+/H+ or K+/H+ antiporter
MLDKTQREQRQKNRQGKIGDRPFWILKLSILLRAIHQIGAAVFLASYLLDAIPRPSIFYVLLTVCSGVALFFMEWMRHREIYRELSGASTFVKLVLLGLAYHAVFPPTPTVVTAFLIASIASHAPKQYRHRLLY